MSRKINGERFSFPFRVARYFPRTYDVHKWRFIEEHCKGISLDLGAHIGLFTVKMARLSEQVIAVEPTEDSFYYLKKTLRLNDISNVTLINMCSSDRSGLVDFYETHNVVSCLNSNLPLEASKLVTKMSFMIDSLGLPIKFMKIDIEGGEIDALKGARKTLEFTKAISLELHPRQLNLKGACSKDLHRELTDYDPKYYKDGEKLSIKEFTSYSEQGEFQIVLGG